MLLLAADSPPQLLLEAIYKLANHPVIIIYTLYALDNFEVSTQHELYS